MSYWNLFPKLDIGSTNLNESYNHSIIPNMNAGRSASYSDFLTQSLMLEEAFFTEINDKLYDLNKTSIRALHEGVNVDEKVKDTKNSIKNAEKSAINKIKSSFDDAVDGVFNSIYSFLNTKEMWIAVNKKKILKTTIDEVTVRKALDKKGDEIGTVIVKDKNKEIYSKILNPDLVLFVEPTNGISDKDITKAYMNAILGEKTQTQLTSFNGKQQKLIDTIYQINAVIQKDRVRIKEVKLDKKYAKDLKTGEEFARYKTECKRKIKSYRIKARVLTLLINEIMTILRIFAHNSKIKISDN